MKLATFVCLFGAISATLFADCSSNADVCDASDECCGVGKKDIKIIDNIATTDVTVCYVKDNKSLRYERGLYIFECNVPAAANTGDDTGAKIGAAQLTITLAAVLFTTLYMA